MLNRVTHIPRYKTSLIIAYTKRQSTPGFEEDKFSDQDKMKHRKYQHGMTKHKQMLLRQAVQPQDRE
jgi:hypothetical protein